MDLIIIKFTRKILELRNDYVNKRRPGKVDFFPVGWSALFFKQKHLESREHTKLLDWILRRQIVWKGGLCNGLLVLLKNLRDAS
jgi:hypothetical protein